MCGIIGYVGNNNVVPTLLSGLARLKYRGYDSAGIAVLDGQRLVVRKSAGKLDKLRHILRHTSITGTVAVGHTRWATHGEPSTANAHPHVDARRSIAVVHNGIIENYAQLKKRLVALGYSFRSHTDTEILTQLIGHYAHQQPLLTAVRRALRDVEGTYALCVVSHHVPGQLIAARKGSPLILGVGTREQLVVSDVAALLGRTRRVVYLEDGDVVVVTRDTYEITNLAGMRQRRPVRQVKWDLAAAQKDGYAHFMLKEIHEQPQAVTDTLANRLHMQHKTITFDARTQRFLRTHVTADSSMIIISCGTAYHAGMVGEYVIEECARIPVSVELASEFRYRNPMINKHTIILAITQSGETADTLAGIHLARAGGAKVLAICNVMGSSIAREADAVIYTHAGPEIAVASTKAYTAQLTALYLLAFALGRQRKQLQGRRWSHLLTGLQALPRLMQATLRTAPKIRRCAKSYAKRKNFYYLGRRHNYPSALEGSLKLKEICPLIHAEGYAAGEMKHGPIAMIRTGWPVVCVAPSSTISQKMYSNIEEIRARHADIISIATVGDRHITTVSQHVLRIPRTDEMFSPMLAAIPLQLLAYEIARINKCDIDQPPNLAKSVTVE